MKKVLLFIPAMLFAILFSANAYSQSKCSIHAGAAFPMGEFGSDSQNDEYAGGAAVGFNVGGKYLSTLNQNGIGVFVGGDFNYNGLKSSVKDDMKKIFSPGVDLSFYKYINIPITAGLNYTYKANSQVSLFGELGVGADFLKVTNMTAEANGQKIEMVFDLSTQFAYTLGGGLQFNDKYLLGLHYYGLGDHNVGGQMKYNGDSQDMDKNKLKVRMLNLTLGIKL